MFLTGVFLGAFDPLPEAPPHMRRLSKGLGVLVCLYGALMLIGVALGGDDPLRPIPQGSLFAGSVGNSGTDYPAFEPVASVAELEVALIAAREANIPVIVDFTAEWCVACKEYEDCLLYTSPSPRD